MIQAHIQARPLCKAALLLHLLSFFVAANSPEISFADLVSHLRHLEVNEANARVNFEKGLTYQLLADAAKSDATGSGTSKYVSYLDKDLLLRNSEESYRDCLAEDPRNTDALSNLAKILSESNNGRSDDNIIANVLELYERAFSSGQNLHIQIYMNYGLFLRELGRLQHAMMIFSQGLLRYPNELMLR